jgi:mono/diheme cytochrome c family protein
MRWTIRLLSTIVAGVIVITWMAAPVSAVDLNAAKQQFGELCARCHGPQGLGDGPDGTTLSTKPRNFHDCTIMAKDADDKVFKEIKGGSASIGRSNDMPSWGEALDDNETQNLVAYVRTFCQQK